MSNLAITLLSDLGWKDTSVSAAKAVLMRYAAAAVFIDISHNVEQYDLQQAAYLLLSAYKYLPEGTVHILLVDVFSGGAPRLMLAEKNGHYFIAPDNGVLSLAFGVEMERMCFCFELKEKYSFIDWMDNAGKIVEAIVSKNISRFEPCEVKTARRLLQPQIVPLGIDCNILYVDRYENVILDLARKQFDEYLQGKPFKIKVMRMQDITTVSNNYNDVPEGEPLCRFNSAGFLEIALNHGPAASLLGLGSYSSGNLRYQTIRIFF